MLFPPVQRDAENRDRDIRVFFREEWDKTSARHLPNNPGMHIPDISWSESDCFYRCLRLKATIRAHVRVLTLVGSLQVKVIPVGDEPFQPSEVSPAVNPNLTLLTFYRIGVKNMSLPLLQKQNNPSPLMIIIIMKKPKYRNNLLHMQFSLWERTREQTAADVRHVTQCTRELRRSGIGVNNR